MAGQGDSNANQMCIRQSFTSRLYGSVGAFLLAFVGLLILGLMAFSVRKDFAPFLWRGADALILESSFSPEPDKEGNYRVTLRYSYQWDGKTFESSRVSASYTGGSKIAKAQKLFLLYPAGTRTRVWVDPFSPKNAVLLRSLPWDLLPLAIILLGFICAGFCGLFLVWCCPPESQGLDVFILRMKPGALRIWLFFFGAVFLLGVLSFFQISCPSLHKSSKVQEWKASPCTILQSRIHASEGGDLTCFSPDIVFEYVVDGRSYFSNNFKFMDSGTSDFRYVNSIVSCYKPGQTATCFVNPEDPAEALLYKTVDLGLIGYFFPVFLMLFGLGGGLLMVYFYRHPTKSRIPATLRMKGSI